MWIIALGGVWIVLFFLYFLFIILALTSLVAQTVKRLPTMQETWVLSLGRKDLEKEMAAHSGTLAWKIPWKEEPGRIQSMGLWRDGHDWATSLHFTYHTIYPFKMHIQHFLVCSWGAAAATAHFRHPRGKPCTRRHSPSSLLPVPRAGHPWLCCLSLWIWLLWTLHSNGITAN